MDEDEEKTVKRLPGWLEWVIVFAVAILASLRFTSSYLVAYGEHQIWSQG